MRHPKIDIPFTAVNVKCQLNKFSCDVTMTTSKGVILPAQHYVTSELGKKERRNKWLNGFRSGVTKVAPPQGPEKNSVYSNFV